jgi:hypothetical protein
MESRWMSNTSPCGSAPDGPGEACAPAFMPCATTTPAARGRKKDGALGEVVRNRG